MEKEKVEPYDVKEEPVLNDLFCSIDGSNDGNCSCKELLQKVEKAFLKIPDLYNECDCSEFECVNPEQCDLIRLSGPDIDKNVNIVKQNSYAFNCNSRNSADLRRRCAMLFVTRFKTKAYFYDLNFDGLRSGKGY